MSRGSSARLLPLALVLCGSLPTILLRRAPGGRRLAIAEPMLDQHRLRSLAIAACLALAVAPTALHAQSPTAVVEKAHLDDKKAKVPARAFGDVLSFDVEVKDARVHCTAAMAKPLVEGMFTCVHLTIDCDDNSNTGSGGYELLIRAAVGSRYQPNAADPAIGKLKAIEHTRLSGSEVVASENGGKSWLHFRIPGPSPEIDENKIRFSFPLDLVRDRGDRYHTRFRTRVSVVTSCSDQPIELEHSCSDAGLPIQLDGKDGDWTGEETTDAGDELHASVRCADVTRLRVDHSDDKVFLCVDFAEEGFGTWDQDDDVAGKPSVSFFVDPMFPRYQSAARFTIPGGNDSDSGSTGNNSWQSASTGKCLEAAIFRAAGQGRYRIVVQSDVELVDWFDGGFVLQPKADK